MVISIVAGRSSILSTQPAEVWAEHSSTVNSAKTVTYMNSFPVALSYEL